MSYRYMWSHTDVDIKGKNKRESINYDAIICCSSHTKASFGGFNANILNDIFRDLE